MELMANQARFGGEKAGQRTLGTRTANIEMAATEAGSLAELAKQASAKLKFCRIADGTLDVYPLFGPTSEWDTAAAQCVLEAAGGVVIAPDGRAFRYYLAEDAPNDPNDARGPTRPNEARPRLRATRPEARPL